MTSLRSVTVVVTGDQTGETYLARAYPTADVNGNGKIELYRVPVFSVDLVGSNAADNPVTISWSGLRFMPYYNDPKRPNPHYSYKGWANAGLRSLQKRAVQRYDPNYRVQNTATPYDGAIQMRDSFLVHAGPPTLANAGWGSAGCVEIIGNFNEFKNDIKTLSGSTAPGLDDALLELVRERMLYVQVNQAIPPRIGKLLAGEVTPNP